MSCSYLSSLTRANLEIPSLIEFSKGSLKPEQALSIFGDLNSLLSNLGIKQEYVSGDQTCIEKATESLRLLEIWKAQKLQDYINKNGLSFNAVVMDTDRLLRSDSSLRYGQAMVIVLQSEFLALLPVGVSQQLFQERDAGVASEIIYGHIS